MKKHSSISRSGRFAGDVDAQVAAFTESVSFDRRLWRSDILGSMAHATMLQRVGLLTKHELTEIVKTLEEIGQEIAAGKFGWKAELEDVHMNIEAELTRRVPSGSKLHTGRSRNDQIALDLRLWLRDENFALVKEIYLLQKALFKLAFENAEVIIPGYTHLQRAQPVFFAHHLLAYLEMLERDSQRLVECYQRVNICPLGSGALAGSTLPLDRSIVATLLGFVDTRRHPRMTQNSMDAVSDRDFVVEFCAAASLIAVHLSRLAEDLVLWSTAEFGFIRLSDAYTTGSSLMPQKKNPDVAELIRGKSGRVFGNLMTVLSLLKALPLTYNRDLQEDKPPLFDSVDTVRACVQLMTGMLGHATVQIDACQKAASDPLLLATDLVDYLVQAGVPFREAHHAVGKLVLLSEKLGRAIDQLTPEEYHSVHPRFGSYVLQLFDVKLAMDRRNLIGAPGRKELRRQLKRWSERLAA